jgi:type I restriction enzyme S subunit
MCGKLPSEVLLGLSVAMPGDDAQCRLSVPLRALNDRIASTRAESRALAALRDALLPELVSGAVRLMVAEKPVELTA